jgi:hypothetical protein
MAYFGSLVNDLLDLLASCHMIHALFLSPHATSISSVHITSRRNITFLVTLHCLTSLRIHTSVHITFRHNISFSVHVTTQSMHPFFARIHQSIPSISRHLKPQVASSLLTSAASSVFVRDWLRRRRRGHRAGRAGW